MKCLKVSVDTYIYVLNQIYGVNEKRNRRYKTQHKNLGIKEVEIEENDFRVTLNEIKKMLDKENLSYADGETESIKVRI